MRLVIVCDHDGSGDSLSDKPILMILDRENDPIQKDSLLVCKDQ